jgi:hypothetical protein
MRLLIFLHKQMGGAPPESDIISLSLYALTTKHTSQFYPGINRTTIIKK